MPSLGIKQSAILLLLCALGLSLISAKAQSTTIDIGTGSPMGVYSAAGGAICRVLNKDRSHQSMTCMVEPTGGSVFNVASLKSHEFNFGIVQSDVAYNAYHGEAQFQDIGPIKTLRSVFSLYPEPLTVLARKEANISSFEDFEGKRFSIGNPGSGTRVSMDKLLAAKGLVPQFFATRAELRAEDLGIALCNDQLDGFSYIIGHPSVMIQDPIVNCGAQLVPLKGAAIDELVAEFPYYAHITIPAGVYPGSDQAIETYGVLATLMTSAEISDEVVYQVVKAVFDNFDDFKRLHPAFTHLQKEDMVKNGLSAPLHPGAERYYKEVGLL